MIRRHLLDANVLIALSFPMHVHHEVAQRWFARKAGRFATCPITQGAFIRHSIREGYSAADALANVNKIAGLPDHEFWPDDLNFCDISELTGVVGHRQVTDVYLAELARKHRALIATFDRGLAALRPDRTSLISTS